MSVITTLVAMPNRMAYACEALSFFSNDGCPVQQLESLLSPLNDSSVDEGGGGSIVKGVLSELIALGLMVKNGDKLTLHKDLSILSEKGRDWMEGLRPILFKRLTNYDEAKKFKQELVPLGFAWLLTQGVLGDLKWSGDHVSMLRKQIKSEDNPLLAAITADARYQNLVTWARYFGLVERINGFVVPDLSEMLIRGFRSFYVGQEKMPIVQFISNLSNYCPVVDTGKVRLALESQLNEPYRTEEGYLSQSLSLALKRLEVSKVIKLEMSDDAESRTLHLGDTVENVSTICLN